LRLTKLTENRQHGGKGAVCGEAAALTECTNEELCGGEEDE
jgi:hypothetical protein